MKAFCDSVILEEPPEPTNVFRVALAVTDFSAWEGVRLDDHIRRDRAVCYCHPLARVLSQNRLVVEEEEEKSGRYPACAHFSNLVSTNTSVWLVILSLWSQVLTRISNVVKHNKFIVAPYQFESFELCLLLVFDYLCEICHKGHKGHS